MTDYFTSTTN